MEYTFSTAQEVINVYGQPLLAKRKNQAIVTIREPQGTEIFGDLTAVQGIDWVVTPKGSSYSHPCKKTTFAKSYEQVGDLPEYRKTALNRLIPIPDGDVVTLNTLEGTVKATYPKYIALGVDDEVYTNDPEFVNSYLDFV